MAIVNRGSLPKVDMFAELFIEYDSYVKVYFVPEETERNLKDDLAKVSSLDERMKILEELVSLYRYANKFDDAIKILGDNIVNKKNYNHWNAHLLFKQGQVLEGKYDFDKAIEYYNSSIQLKIENAWLNYFQYNNIGFCYNFKMKFEEADYACREAIKINPDFYNAWKNLGVSLEHQGRYLDAAKCYLTAINLNMENHRAAMHLKRMISRQPRLRENLDLMKDYIFKKLNGGLSQLPVAK